ncbi:hypothetical protein PENSUB_2172 [Penicillium subrubescens]|uniref:Major facilitator superfamily (MFS) profile domain-containing protein n=1 Tax=Penicillium subrubescens TaxID=1316194 RepID=A0A1Q5URM9_9EURO|nr:hypothetical protein PENSUB_2172 [Penicillium subrubescens]
MARKNDSKPPVDHIEDTENPGITDNKTGDAALALFNDPKELHSFVDPAEEKRLVRKIDLMILPSPSVYYIFFYRFPTAKYLSMNIILWGILLALHALAKNFTTLAVLRGLSGAAEACGDPAFMLITGMWYTRREQPIKIGLWYSSLGFGIVGGSLLGYAIGQIKRSLPSWQYESIIGAFCVSWGIIMFIILPDSPVSAPFLSIEQRKSAVERLRENQIGIENRNFKRYQSIEAFADLKVL